VHVVVRGDTLYAISRRYGVSVQDLVKANGIVNPSLIYVGQRITIPGRGPAPAPSGDTVHVVQRGETLTRISLKYGVSIWSIVNANGIRNPNLIYVGQRLKIPGR
jgi:putative chitinase